MDDDKRLGKPLVVMVTPRVLAGGGYPPTALRVLEDACWRRFADGKGNAYYLSPDTRVRVAFRPEDEQCFRDARTLWTVYVYEQAGDYDPVWIARFSDEAPAELVAAFFAALADPEPIPRDFEHYPVELAHVTGLRP